MGIDYSKYKNYIRIIGENTDEKGNITTYRCRNHLGVEADTTIEDTIKAINNGIIWNAVVNKRKNIVWAETPDSLRLKLYRQYIRQYIFLNKSAPLTFEIIGNDIILVGVEQDGETLTIPNFCTGFGLQKKQYTQRFNMPNLFIGAHYKTIIIDNMPDTEFQMEGAFRNIDQQHMTIKIKHPECVKNIQQAFANACSLETVEFICNTPLQPESMDLTFSGCAKLRRISGNLDTSKTTRARYLFDGCAYMQEILENIKLDFQNLRVASNMFMCTIFSKHIDLRQFKFRRIETADYMFSNAKFKSGIDILGMNLKQQNSCCGIFQNTEGLNHVEISDKGLSVGDTDIEQAFYHQDVKSITIRANMINMVKQLERFAGYCEKLETVEMKEQHLKNLCHRGLWRTFERCRNLKRVDMGKVYLDTTVLVQTDQMFATDRYLKYVDIGNMFIQQGAQIDRMFDKCTRLETLIWNTDHTDISRDGTGSKCLYGCQHLKQVINKYNSKI